MSEIVPFSSAQLPAYLQNRKALAAINKDVVTAAAFPTLSIKGKVFTLVKDNERKMMMRPDPDEPGSEIPAQSIQLSVLRANAKSRVYYKDSYEEGSSDGARPTCTSSDGVAPNANSVEPQAKKCQVCPHAVWGSKLKDDGTAGEGTECSVNTRLAVAAPDDLKTVFLLRVPAGSRKNYGDAVKMADSRGIPYNALVMKVSFDPTAPSPKLVFKPVGLLPDDAYAKATELYESDMVRDIVGLGNADTAPAPAPEGGVEADELDAAIAAKTVVTKAAAKPAPAPVAAKVTPKAKPVADASAEPAGVSLDDIESLVEKVAPAKPAPAPVAAKAPAVAKAPAPPAPPMDDLLSELDDLLGNSDD